jgi:hypothetical protein
VAPRLLVAPHESADANDTTYGRSSLPSTILPRLPLASLGEANAARQTTINTHNDSDVSSA